MTKDSQRSRTQRRRVRFSRRGDAWSRCGGSSRIALQGAAERDATTPNDRREDSRAPEGHPVHRCILRIGALCRVANVDVAPRVSPRCSSCSNGILVAWIRTTQPASNAMAHFFGPGCFFSVLRPRVLSGGRLGCPAGMVDAYLAPADGHIPRDRRRRATMVSETNLDSVNPSPGPVDGRLPSWLVAGRRSHQMR